MLTRPNEREPVQIARAITHPLSEDLPSRQYLLNEAGKKTATSLLVEGLHEPAFMPKRPARAPTRESAAPFVPPKPTLRSARAAAAGCTGCDLFRHATQTVFGEGPATAAVMFVGEQPGDAEDLAGRPFAGPAGRVFDKALEAVGIARDRVYVTNVVKHFKWEPRGKRRIHKKPRLS